jgi:ribose-phosphate pyrophosphokinase
MKYTRIKYPDGQISCKIEELTMVQFDTITERVNNYEDLIFLKSIVDAAMGKQLMCTIPCLLGQRSDRRFDINQSFDLKIIADIINSCNFKHVAIFDPHSDVCLALINNSYKLGPESFVEKAIKEINSPNLILISPDAGAYKKVFGLGERFNLPVISGIKYRDNNGNITLSFSGDVKDKDCLIVDDICDGGATFIALSQNLKDSGARNVYLYVSHGIFSKGFKELNRNITRIFCTNSYKDIGDYESDGISMVPTNVKQFKFI